MPQAYFIRKAYFTLRSNISLVPLGTNFIEKDDCRSNRLFWWERVDSDHRSETQQIYSLPPLATRERFLILSFRYRKRACLLRQSIYFNVQRRKMELVDGLEPPTC